MYCMMCKKLIDNNLSIWGSYKKIRCKSPAMNCSLMLLNKKNEAVKSAKGRQGGVTTASPIIDDLSVIRELSHQTYF